MNALKRIIPYIKGTLNCGLFLNKSNSSSLVSQTDVDWGRCLDTCHSTYGHYVLLEDNLVSWSFKWQPTISKSSAEVEYKGITNVISESCWLHNLRLELNYPITKATPVYCDNVSTIYLSSNTIHYQ